ncbi:hypothetical protein RD792_011617 [Penstemon davidsonii]|uniref:Calcium-transporting ATPase n=1 Tax=Penstemon davidsonii TaxID=160366 RepID=A0ABR0CV36_9LAMI|nr:hypothetical protein RD792_011617 [Penstemon davidsonii]
MSVTLNSSFPPEDYSFSNSEPSNSLNNAQTNFSTALEIESTRFSTIEWTEIAKLVRGKDQRCLRDHGGIEGIVLALETNTENGIHGDIIDRESRRKTFGSNFYSAYTMSKCFSLSALESVKDPMVVLLFVCAVISLFCGLKKGHLWEGVATLLVILAVVVISAGVNFWTMYQFGNVSFQGSYFPEVDVVRNGNWHKISTGGVVVGDIIFLKPGDQIPADGLFIDGCSLQVERVKIDGQVERETADAHENMFLLCGNTVVDGYARMLVTAVGKNKKHHMMYMNVPHMFEMKRLTSVIGNIGKGVALVSFLVLLGRFLCGKLYDVNGNLVCSGGTSTLDVMAAMVGILATPAMIALTSNPEGLVLSVKMGFAYSMRMLIEVGVLVKETVVFHILACVTTICINKTGTLTKNFMEVSKFWVGLNSIEEVPRNFIASNVIELLHQGIGLNITEPPTRSSSSPTNSTEKAIFDWAIKHLGMDVEALKRTCTIFEIEPFNSKNRRSGLLISNNVDNTVHVHRKGSPEVIIPMCSHYYESTTGVARVINKSTKALFEKILEDMAENGQRCIAFAHRKTSIRDYFTFSKQQLILLGIVGLTNPQRSWTRVTVEGCKKAGVNLKLITGDHPITARINAIECGILGPEPQHGEVVEGMEFRNFTAEERMEKLENIKVLARATPYDKLLMVQCLRQKRHMVACVGRGIGDYMALRAAHIPICFGTEGAQFAVAYSPIVFTKKRNFLLILEILLWGRGICYNIQAYTEFLITATFVSLIVDSGTTIFANGSSTIDAVSHVSSGRVPYPAFQLLWVKLIVGTFSALALIIKPPSQSLLNKPPRNAAEPILTSSMVTNISIQALYQVIILFTINFKGMSLFKVNSNQKDAMILNTYIVCQVFAMVNASLLGYNNVIEEMKKKKMLWGIMGIIISIQVLMLEVLKRFLGTAKLDLKQWGACIAMAASSWLLSGLLRTLPDLKKAIKYIIDWSSFKPKVD